MKFKSHTGASVIEFAVLLPLLIVLIFGIIEFGMLLYNQQVITNASREGARAGIVAQDPRVTDGQIALIVNSYTSNHLVTFGATNNPVTSVTRTGISFGDDLKVTVTYIYGFLTIPNFIPGITNPRTMTAATLMRYE